MLFKTESGGSCFFIAGRDLRVGSLVLAADDQTLLEVVRIVPQQTEALIELCTDETAPFKTTASHRVMAPSYGQEAVTLKAGDFKEGSFVLRSGLIATKVTKINKLNEANEVLAITFKPDEAVVAFLPPEGILTKGQTFKPTRRSGMNKRKGDKNEQHVECELESIPPTAPGEYQD
jgi:hypothetical protein